MDIVKRSKQTDSLCKFCKHVDTCSVWSLIKYEYAVISCSKDPDKANVDYNSILVRRALRRSKDET